MEQHPVTFVSLGPGEAELITLKGLRILQQSDVILCPATVTGNGHVSSRAADILHQLEIPDDKIRLFPLPMSKDRSLAMQVYDRMFESAAALYKEAYRVAVVAEGDAGFYSSIHYVYDRLHTIHIPVCSVPGIPAFIACGAIAGLHVVQQEERLVVIPGNTNVEELSELLDSNMTVVIMKLSQCTDELHRFIPSHPSYYYHYFENAGTEKEYYSTDISELQNKAFPYFSLMIIQKHI
ncbi:precorrin-2 C(20)-methyltransferase [Bacteroides sp. 51]|uniref:precorrin-2 C(20)-methyltransferase n=1 Tax=Bacteroides sp. 51 TaxID=2302938 RepID=UPI0013D5C721|nr:precorrin-2 C(20)-methyltransferase [Bacteroides sp. 51]NDV81986.1 precorrin-2 C(20)-methyltransferase [Bacteroides sp. 51]